MQAHGILATRNFSAGRYEDFEMVSGEELTANHLLSNSACTTCVIRCGRAVKVDGKTVKGPELEILGLLGPNILNNDIEQILKWMIGETELNDDSWNAFQEQTKAVGAERYIELYQNAYDAYLAK